MIYFKKKVLYCFIAHQKTHKNVLKKINNLIYPAICVVGGSNNYFDGKTLYVDSNDNYDGLPEKVFKALIEITKIDELNNFSHICKLDEDMEIKRLFPQQALRNINYGGNIQYSDGDRFWGMDKFSTNSKFSNNPYEGPFVPWCRGGYGYLISRKAINQIKKITVNFYNEPYEDLLIAKLLHKKNIYPKKIDNLDKYIYSRNHQ